MFLTIDEPALSLKMANKAINQCELMSRGNISQSVIKKIQTGKPIQPKTVGKIARVLDCDPAEIATPIIPLREAARVIQGKHRSPLQAAADALSDR